MKFGRFFLTVLISRILKKNNHFAYPGAGGQAEDDRAGEAQHGADGRLHGAQAHQYKAS